MGDYLRRKYGYSPEYYIMSERSSSELLKDKSWLANSSALFVKTPNGKKMTILGSGHGYGSIVTSHSYIFDTGNGYRKPPYGQETFKIYNIITFNSHGEPSKPFKAIGGFYVMK